MAIKKSRGRLLPLKGCAKMGITRMIMNPQLLSNHKVQNLFDGYDVEPYTLRRAYVKYF